MARELVHFVFEPVNGEEDSALASCPFELGVEGFYSLGALSELGGNVHDESGANLSESSGVENFVGAKGFAFNGELLQTCEEATFVAQG